MEFVIAIVGLGVAVWMILGARSRHRDRAADDETPSD
jgi:hypothetical protein